MELGARCKVGSMPEWVWQGTAAITSGSQPS